MRKVTSLLGRRRRESDTSRWNCCFAPLQPLPGPKEKQLILDRRPAEGESILVLVEKGLARGKKAAGCERTVPVEFERAAVNLIGPRLGHHTHHPACRLSKLSTVVAGDEAELLNCIRIWVVQSRVEILVGILNSIERI